jgi:hypothetical protein
MANLKDYEKLTRYHINPFIITMMTFNFLSGNVSQARTSQQPVTIRQRSRLMHCPPVLQRHWLEKSSLNHEQTYGDWASKKIVSEHPGRICRNS